MLFRDLGLVKREHPPPFPYTSQRDFITRPVKRIAAQFSESQLTSSHEVQFFGEGWSTAELARAQTESTEITLSIDVAPNG